MGHRNASSRIVLLNRFMLGEQEFFGMGSSFVEATKRLRSGVAALMRQDEAAGARTGPEYTEPRHSGRQEEEVSRCARPKIHEGRRVTGWDAGPPFGLRVCA